MDVIRIKGQEYEKEEVIKRGSSKIKVVSNVFRWVGVAIFLTGLIPFLALVFSYKNLELNYSLAYMAGYLFIPVFAPHMLVGLILFIISFKKRNALRYGIRDIEKELPNNDNTIIVNVNNSDISKQQSDDKFEQIKKYKELLDEGIITQDEFDEKKRELL